MAKKKMWHGGSTPAERGYGHEWRKTRERILARDPVCRICGLRASTEVDHAVPKFDGGTEDDSNLQGVCHGCHEHKSAQEAQIGRVRPIRILCGPPGCSFADYIAPRRKPTDLVIEIGAMVAALGFREGTIPPITARYAKEAFDACVRLLPAERADTRAWVITQAATQRERDGLRIRIGGAVVDIPTPPHLCLDNLTREHGDAHANAMRPIVDAWWARYEPPADAGRQGRAPAGTRLARAEGG